MIKIMQIMPSDNWWAVYENMDEPYLSRLVCWALVQIGGGEMDRSVTGMDETDGKIEFCQEIENFRTYVYAKDEKEALEKYLESL